MVDFLKVNDYPIRVKVDTPQRTPVERGTKQDSATGKPLRVINKRTNDFNMETPPLTKVEAETVRGLLEGWGHFYPFDDTRIYSSKGLPAISVDEDAVVDTDENILDLTGDYTAEFEPAGTPRWSVAFKSAGTGYVKTSEGDIYEGGEEGSLPSGVTITDDEVSFTDITLTDLIIVPFVATQRFAEVRHETTNLYSRVPKIRVDGVIVSEETMFYGTTGEREYQPFYKDGVYHYEGQTISFDLTEV